MSRRKVKVNCLFCNKEFESALRWEGIPEKEYCTEACRIEDEEYAEEENFEKFSKGGKVEWH